ncbi:family 20 glycosylhydrolase [Mangrovivirga sp. M17]|uniref:beta-N-acetylhexosaminidase n=1 Tax=Mangrovivirga halotolerans TaxID=2993936 RepID=A0ABT3RWC2_9BACT|nr:family 20 glycosylhydrolase [Mangrovivirga halotolerans]MCX2745522.1 family 20 glycosylhydrolase [Mangrovivirga halotolerans]
MRVRFLIIFLLPIIFSCSSEKKITLPKTNITEASIIPKPLDVTPSDQAFALDQYSALIIDNDNTGFKTAAEFLINKINLKTGLTVPSSPKDDTRSIIKIYRSNIKSDNEEAYELEIKRDTIKLTANNATGIFRGIQTLRQLIPEHPNDSLANHNIWIIPGGKVTDEPRFEYRSTMLDVSRHFFEADYIKKYIEILAYYKINILHLHLSDDQGWRIEIKSWPRLTEFGGSTEVGGGQGGFYTQEQYKDIVAHAEAHHITIVPEIDMPGHTNAASASYPFLNGNGQKPELYTGTKVGFSTFDTRSDTVYSFIDDVIREISSITPGPYFHIGGDESHVTKKEDYLYFINRVENIVQKYDKRMIGWDEVANADLDSTSIVQFWNDLKNAELAVEKNLKVILSPANKAYLDMKYDSLTKIGYDWAGLIPVDSAYLWDPEEYLSEKYILGIDAPLWSETFDSTDGLEYLAFPRLIGYSELSWTTPENRDWKNYKSRLADQAEFLKRMNINYYKSPLIEWKE